ncbi:unnamed protein product [Effrenium voratum]|nr:unnamed protein product [Effrenium voratum]
MPLQPQGLAEAEAEWGWSSEETLRKPIEADCNTVRDLENWVRSLKQLHEHTLPGEIKPPIGFVLEISFRMAMLAYGRNDGKSALYRGFKAQGSDEVSLIEAQFKGLGHVDGVQDDSAHLAAFLVKLKEGGVGLVLGYKGSTNMADWSANLQSPRWLLESQAEPRRSDGESPMAPLAELLLSWGVEVPSTWTFADFVLSNKWQWCVCVGHSLGGAMSAIEAEMLAVPIHKSHPDQKNIFAVGVGSAIPGNPDFVKSMARHVLPFGGLRIENDGDSVTKMGWGGLHLMTRVVHGMEWRFPQDFWTSSLDKLHMHIEFDVNDHYCEVKGVGRGALRETCNRKPNRRPSSGHRRISESGEVTLRCNATRSAGVEELASLLTDAVSGYYHERGIHCSAGEAWVRFFGDCDVDGSGRISFDELETAIRKRLRSGISRYQLLVLWRQLDSDNSGEVSVEEVVQFLYRVDLSSWPEAEVQSVKRAVRRLHKAGAMWHQAAGNWYKIFLQIDFQSRGFITLDDLKRAVRGGFYGFRLSAQARLPSAKSLDPGV